MKEIRYRVKLESGVEPNYFHTIKVYHNPEEAKKLAKELRVNHSYRRVKVVKAVTTEEEVG